MAQSPRSAEDERSITNSQPAMDVLAQLKAFRQAAYNYLGKAHDATFELTDAVMLTRNAYCLADFSLSPIFRWSSLVFTKHCKTVDHNDRS